MTRKWIKILVYSFILICAPASAEIPVITKSGPLPQAGTGRGLVIFYRPGLMGALLGCTVREKNEEILRLGAKKYSLVYAVPGIHEYSTRGELKDGLRLEVEEGETYFVRCNVSAGNWGGRANLEPSNRAEFADKAPRLNLSSALKIEN